MGISWLGELSLELDRRWWVQQGWRCSLTEHLSIVMILAACSQLIIRSHRDCHIVVLNNFKNSHNTNVAILLAVECVQRSRSVNLLINKNQIFISMPCVLISKKEFESAEVLMIIRIIISMWASQLAWSANVFRRRARRFSFNVENTCSQSEVYATQVRRWDVNST